MRRANIVSGAVLAIFGLAMIVFVIPWQIEPGPEGIMSPALVPQLMMVLVVALSALLILTSLREAVDDDTPSPVSRGDLIALAKVGTIFAVAIAAYLWISPLAAGAALVIGALLALGERRPFVLVLMPAAFLTAIWLLFYRVLGTAIL